MAEGSKAMISRRSTRYFTEHEGVMEVGGSERPGYGTDDIEKEKLQREKLLRESKTPTASLEATTIPMMDLGKDLGGLFPRTSEDSFKNTPKSLQAAKASSKSKVDGRPLNFGTVIPNTIYRSSFPQIEDFQFLGTLGLKSIVSLVGEEFSPEFKAFMRTHNIKHCIVEMQGTKKVAITENVMNSIMEIVLDKKNHPLLIHCNHGKHRTGCAVAVIRHVSGWEVERIVEEYRGHAEPKIRQCDVTYITNYQMSSLQAISSKKKTGSNICSSRMTRMIVGTAIVLLIWLATILGWENRQEESQ